MNKSIVALATSSIMLLSSACAPEVGSGSEFTGADSNLSPADVVVSEELMGQELEKPTAAEQNMDDSAPRLGSRSEAIAKADLALEQAFAQNFAKSPNLMSAGDAKVLRGELSLYLRAALDKDVINATKHWNNFSYKLVSLPPQRSGLALAGDDLAGLVPGILKVVINMVTAITSQNPVAIVSASIEIVGLVFQAIQAFS